jgi:signal transduction histidine kinase
MGQGNVIRMFVTDQEVAALEQEFLASTGTQHLQVLVALAWYLRQRDTRRAELLVCKAQTMLASSYLPLQARQRLTVRILITLAEIKCLFVDLDAGLALIDQGLQELSQLDDVDALADALWIRGMIRIYQGDAKMSGQVFGAALAAAQRAQDPMRVRLCLSALGVNLAYRDQQAAVAEYGSLLDLTSPGLTPEVLAPAHDFWASVAAQRSQFDLAIEHWSQCLEYAMQVGQNFRSVLAFVNICDSFNNLNDHYSALEWMQRGLDLARSNAWPIAIGACLMQMGETLRRMGRLQSAQVMLDDALKALAVVPASRTYAAALGYFADLALDRHDWPVAYRTFCHLHRRAEALDQPEFLIHAMRGQAQALLQMQSIEAALVAAQVARSLAVKKQDSYLLMDVLKVLADIYAQHVSLDISGTTSVNVSLQYLLQVQQIAASINGYILPGEVLDALAKAYAAANDYDAAFSAACAAREAYDKVYSQEASNRVVALRIRHEAEHAQAEREYHRQLAQAEAERVHTLQVTSEILLHLGSIGQEIAAHLDVDGLFQSLNRHVHSLLSVHLFRIYLLDEEGQSLTSVLSVEHEQLADSHHAFNTSNLTNAARCVREQREIMINGDADSEAQSIGMAVSGGIVTQNSGYVASPVSSRLFAPLMIGERVLGVMTIQSVREHAYGEREQLIFRTLCAYGAIALDNANAYHQLKQAQSQLVEQEKLAALGALVAGVAHELNVPIVDGLHMSCELAAKVDALNLEISERRLRQSYLTQFVADTGELAHQILRCLTSAAGLVSSFKQVAVDRTSAKRRIFFLQQTCEEIIDTLQSQLRLSGHAIELDVPDDIMMDSYPGSLGQVLIHIIHHAQIQAGSGHMSLTARQVLSGRVTIIFTDRGKGIPQQILCRLFDPFFSTKARQGDNSFEMNIVQNMVTSLLNGKIQIESTPEAGTIVVLDLPLTVAQSPETSTV